MFNITVSSHTDIGDVKRSNQDSILVKVGDINFHKVGLFVVADGCGGMSYGDEISNLVVAYFSRVWNHELKELFDGKKVTAEEIDGLLEKAIEDINVGALNFSRQVESKVGSTLSLLLTVDDKYYIKNVGDSRIYLKRGRKFKQLTQDQSLVADMIRNGDLTKEEAIKFKRKNVLTMCIGVFDVIRTYSVKGKIKNGDNFLLCCDGLHNLVPEKKLAEIISDNKVECKDKCKAMRDSIPQGNAKDNVSSVLCRFVQKKGNRFRVIMIATIVAFVLFAIAFTGGLKGINIIR